MSRGSRLKRPAAHRAATDPWKPPVAHWGAREWRRNQDDLVLDPEHPQAFPPTYPMDLMGRIRVKLTAEDGDLVAYGFGGQRIVLPHASVGAVHTVSEFRFGSPTSKGGIKHDRALLVLDHDGRVLLRANGLWETYGEVQRVCHAAKLPGPSHLTTGYQPSYQSSSRGNRRGTRARVTPRYEKAPGYQRLRVYPRGRTLRVLAVGVLFALAMGFGGFLGVLPAMALPVWVGAVRTLLAIIGGVLGVAAGIWVAAAITHLWVDVLRWAGASLKAGGIAPLRRFFTPRREHTGTWKGAANVGLAALLIAMVGWGPGVGIASLAHGLRDSSLVAQLRANGVTTHGSLTDVPDYETDDNGKTTEKDVSTLSFNVGGQLVQDPDPAIGGRPLPLFPNDPIDTNVPETIVYLPDNLDVAAAKQQITGSVWHGAPTANEISGWILTVALPPFGLFLVLRLRRLRWNRAKDLVDDLSK